MNTEQRVFDVLSPELRNLMVRGWLKLVIHKTKAPQPSIAWTTFTDKKFNVHLVGPFVDDLSDEALNWVVRHEIYHVILNHFSIKPCGTDLLIASDIQVNWYLQQYVDEMKELDTKLAEFMGTEEAKHVDPYEWLEFLGLTPQPYPATMLHDLLHEKAEHAESWCGGAQVSEEDLLDAQVNAAVVGASTGIGSLAGRESQTITGHMVPNWVRAVEDFARALVHSILADKRTPTRPNKLLQRMGAYVPTIKPRWDYRPDTICLLVDTSGSMLSILPQLGPAIGFLTQHNITVRLISGDMYVSYDEEVTAPPTSLPGGGGTDILPLFERAATYHPKSIICLTDGYVPSWPSDPQVPVLWITNSQAPFGSTTSYED